MQKHSHYSLLAQKNKGPQILQNPYIQLPQPIQLNQRYLYIRIINITNIDPTLLTLQNTIQFHCYLGNKNTSTTLTIQNNQLSTNSQDIVKKQTHLFCYEAEQILTIQINQSNQNCNTQEVCQNRKRSKICQSGISRILLTPLVVLPYTRHKIKTQLVNISLENNKIQTKKVGRLELEIYYFLKFQGKIQICPINAKFTLNRANIGMMRACCILTINNQRKKTVIDEQGGIYPNWQKQSLKLQKLSNIKTTNSTNQTISKQTINNRLVFSLNSVGHVLKIQIINFPIFDHDAQLVGQTIIQLQSQNFFLICNKDVYHHDIKVYYTHPHNKQKVQAGTVNLKTKFIYNAKAIRKQVDSEDDYQL